MPLDDWSIPGNPSLPAPDTHTHSLVINSCTSGMLWWKWLHGSVSPGPLGYGRSGVQSCAFSGQRPPGLCCGEQLSYSWTCTPLWLQWKLRIRCLQPAQGPVASAQGLVLTSPHEAGPVGRSGWREEEWIMLFPADSTALSCFLLSQLNDICTSCSQKESLWWNVTGFNEWSFLHPSLLSLLPPVHPSSAFSYSERTLPWNSKCRKK